MPTDRALARYAVVSAYLAQEPKRGACHALLEQLAARTWTDPAGRTFQVGTETIRAWVRRFRRRGLPGLEDAARPKRGTAAIPPELVDRACDLKRQVPRRSIDLVIRILEETGEAPAGLMRRSTLHRALRANGLSRRVSAAPSTADLGRFEAAAPNDLWQSDATEGPWLPDPERPGKVRRAWLFAFIDDHSRLQLGGRWSFKQDLPHLEQVFRDSLRRYGAPRRVYYDNGSVYRARHMATVCGRLELAAVVFTTRKKPTSHGKIERFNGVVVEPFIEEVQRASAIRTLDQLNEAWSAWVESQHNAAARPKWNAGLAKVRWVDEATIAHAFRWEEERKADATGVFSLFGKRYEANAEVARRKITLIYDPEDLREVEVHLDGRFVVRARPLAPGPQRRPAAPRQAEEAAPIKGVDYLGHLVARHRRPPDPQALVVRRAAQDAEVLVLCQEALDEGAYDAGVVRAWLARFGPLDPERLAAALPALITRLGADVHPSVLLDAFRKEQP